MNKNSKSLVVVNSITLVLMLFLNFAGSTGFFSQQTVADVSHKHDTLFAPANYAFIIWGFLFLLAIAFVIFQWVLLKNNDPKNFIQRTGIWFSLSNIVNAAWIFFWVNEMTGWAVVLICMLLICLVILTVRLRLEMDDEPVRTIFFVWWPITFYLGWIMVATVACVSAWLVSIGWNAGGLQQDTWTIIMIAIAGLLYILLIIKRNMREASIVGVWAFIAIAIRQWDTHFNISVAAIVASAILTIASLVHVYKNRYYGVGPKLKRGEWK
ncbi:MAG: hypothetical protein M3R50_01995 [Bacteroidota bacterium]|nr:hypothetical protein [Bacteroidota bacterium]